MLELHRGGASAREIGTDLGISHVSIAKWLRDAGLQPQGGSGDRKTRPRRAAATSQEAAEVSAETLADIADLPADREAAHGVVARRLSSVRSLLDRVTSEVQGGEFSASSYGQLVRVELELAARLAELAPPVPVDPEADVGNVEAAASVGRRLARLVEAAEQTVACPHCHAMLYAAAS